jgi:putative heme-binding domain-containing protein
MKNLVLQTLWLAVFSCILSNPTAAQHATAFDVEDGARAFADSCANCHGPDGDLIQGIDLGRGLFRRPLSDQDIADIIMNGIPNTPMPPTPRMSEEQALRIVAYLRSLAQRPESDVTGDPLRGRELFASQGECMDCHRVNGEGSRIGPDLSRIGLMRRAVEIEAALLDPTAEVQPANRFYTVTLADGETITGRLLNHSTYSIQMYTQEDGLRSFQKDALRSHGFTESPMPPADDKLNPQEIADVVSYLVSLKGEESPDER